MRIAVKPALLSPVRCIAHLVDHQTRKTQSISQFRVHDTYLRCAVLESTVWSATLCSGESKVDTSQCQAIQGSFRLDSSPYPVPLYCQSSWQP